MFYVFGDILWRYIIPARRRDHVSDHSIPSLVTNPAQAAEPDQHALLDRERHYQNVIDNTVDGYFAIDPQRRFIEVNDSLCRMFGTPRGEWMGKTPLDFITEQSRTELIRQMQRIESSEHRRYQLVGLRKDASTFPILLNTTTMRDGVGAVLGSFGFITDISAVVAAQQAVAESERELRGILDNLQDTYYRTDLEGRVIRVSPSVMPLLGYTPEEFFGQRLADHYIDPAARDVFLLTLREGGGEVTGYESPLRHKDGRVVWVLTNAHYVRDPDGRITGIEGTTRDITERRLADEQLRLAAKVFADSGRAIMITGADNRIVSVNRTFCEVTGYSVEDVVGEDPKLLASGRHDAEFFRDMWASIRDAGSWQGEVWNRRKNGEVFPEWLRTSAVRDATGAITHYVAIFSDISERKAVEARMDFLAHHDPLTHLPNRVLFRDRVE